MSYEELLEEPEPPFEAVRGQTIYRNTGELSFETRPREAGTFPVTFLEWVYEYDPCGEDPDRPGMPLPVFYGRVINERRKIENVHHSLLSCFNI